MNSENKNIDSLGFIIIRHINDEKTNLYWQECYNSIRKFYDNKILIIDDNSNKLFIKFNFELNNCEIIESEYPGRGEMLAYFYFLKLYPFKKAVILHDSCFLQTNLNFEEEYNVKFLWSFEHFWNDDKRIIELLLLLKHNTFLINKYINNNTWRGCFGVMSVINYSFLKQIEEKYNFLNILINHIKTRQDRMCIERIFALLCSIEDLSLNIYPHILGNIHRYIPWGVTYENYISKKYKGYPIMKIWTGR